MCSPCGTVCYRFEDCGPADETKTAAKKEEECEKKKKSKSLKKVRSRELIGGVLLTGCHCIKRNGLQHDCRRTLCRGRPACLVLPDPVCPPSFLARARGLAPMLKLPGGENTQPTELSNVMKGKKFVVCELQGATKEAALKALAENSSPYPAGKDGQLPIILVVRGTGAVKVN